MILLTGASGYVGNAFQNFLLAKGIEFEALSLREPEVPPGVLLQRAIESHHPEFIINAAGYTGKPNVDAAEDDKFRCLEGNVILPGIVSEICTAQGIPWGHVSSGCIFEGSRSDGNGFTEEDAPNFDFRHNNCSFYSGTKALAEEILPEAGEYFIWRLRIPYNELDSPRNYLSKLMSYDSLIDVNNSISQIDEFVRACWQSWETKIPFGTYNITNPGSITTREVVDLINQSKLGKGRDWSFFRDEAEFYRVIAKAPRSNCLLDSSKIMNHGICLTEVRESIRWCLENWRRS